MDMTRWAHRARGPPQACKDGRPRGLHDGCPRTSLTATDGGLEMSRPFPTSAETLEELLVYDTAE